MKDLIKYFPRQIAMPYRKLCITKKDFWNIYNANNGLRNIYYSIYNVDQNNQFSIIKMDKIYFDFDEVDAIEDVRNMHKWCTERNLKHCFMFSGKKGFNFYIFTKNYESVLNLKDCLFNVHNYFVTDLGVKLDIHVKGDIARIARIPGSWHASGRRFCTSLKEEQLDLTFEELKEVAKKQLYKIYYYGEELLDLIPFDHPKKTFVGEFANIELEEDIELNDKVVDKFPTFIKAWLKDIKHPITGDKMGNYKARYYFAIYCKTIGFPKSLCDEIARKYFSRSKRKDYYKTNYQHFKRHNVLEYAYKDDRLFPNYQTLMGENLHVGERPKKDDFGLYD